ncbi:hypothetical protein C8J56DRAFT_426624 [Mycena floridula]|nr:hypothetical protein C8J56DRAFT_426624 [Mycena floridula]
MAGVHPYKITPTLTDSSSGPMSLPSKASKRIRGEIACAECRRLKVKCDKNIPCQTCVKRGCSKLCPNGTIPPGQGSRFVTAASDHLVRRITSMEARMHSLEDALAIAYAPTSDKPHPLLLASLEDSEEPDEQPTLKPVAEDQADLISAFGTLYVDKDHSRFFGGGTESLLLQKRRGGDPPSVQHPLPELDPSYLPAEINQFSRAFPFVPFNVPSTSVQTSIESFLPPISRAITLCDTFLEHLSWMFHIVSRKQIVDELIPVVYKTRHASYGPHDLALLLVVLGIGALVDLNLEPYNLEAQHYYQLARAALGLQPVLAERSVVTIKVLHLMSIYNGMSGKESNLEHSYALLTLAAQVALKIGFHIDPSMWGLSGKEAYERRTYFWNLLQACLWQSLVTGRPPAILSLYIDCRIPTPEEEEIFQQGEVPLGFGIWGIRASDECLVHVVRATLAAKPPAYEKVMELDQKIRDFVLPAQSQDSFSERTALSMRSFVRSHYQDLMLMFLHRAFFAQGMVENPTDPLAGRHGPSILAAYHSSCVVLDDTKIQFMKKPLLCTRIWRIWTNALTAALIVGTVAIKGPHLNLEPPALEQFEAACRVFQSAAQTSSRAARSLPVLETMLEKAIHAHRVRRDVDEGSNPESKLDDQSILLFGGQATLLQNVQEKRVRHPPVTNPDLYSNPNAMGQTTFADLSQGWPGMFHETPVIPAHGVQFDAAFVSGNYSGDSAMLDDRWSSFMHNYNLDNPQNEPMYSIM